MVAGADPTLSGIVTEPAQWPGVISWPGRFIAAEGEHPDWDTPRGMVDWTGFELALQKARVAVPV